MIRFVIDYFNKIAVVLVGLFGIYILKRNKQLSLDNQSLEQDVTYAKKVSVIQNKVLDVTQNTKPTNFAGIIELLRKNKL